MKKVIALLFILLLTGCNSNSAVEKLKEEYPKTVKEVAEKLPGKIQEELAASTELPFAVDNVVLRFTANPPEDPKGDIFDTEFMYGGEGVNLHITTYHYKNTTFSSEDKKFKTVKLKNNIKALIEGDDENTKEIRWKKEGLYYSIMIIKSPKNEKKYTIEDIVKIADSMEY
ncbi:hypothetical protein ACIQD3_03730 [Peribacillus loiseleuriae]|uniref:hypothetical protein n=1 Tax=Peribacillus loiseleuriae TaxID=1679170 RepID=UPI003811BCD3